MTKSKIARLFFPHDDNPEHFKALDGLRGVAVLFVLLSHSSNVGLFFFDFLNFKGMGKVGVYLFFVLSAYLLDRQIASHFLYGSASTKYWFNYILRRFLRIFPLFFVGLSLFYLCNSLGIPTVIRSSGDIFTHLFLLKGESIFWSIPVEFKYYLLSPMLLFICHYFCKWKPFLVMLFFTALIAASILANLYLEVSSISTFRFLPIFIIGTIISIFELIREKQYVTPINAKVLDYVALVSSGLLFLSIPFYFEKVFSAAVDFHEPIYYLPYSILWGMILISAKHGFGLVRSFLEWKFLRFVGSISFSVYLFHIPFLRLVQLDFFDLPNTFKIYAFFIMTFAFSSVTYLLIERPLSKLRISKVIEKHGRYKF